VLCALHTLFPCIVLAAYGGPKVVNDGVMIAKAIKLPDAMENLLSLLSNSSYYPRYYISVPSGRCRPLLAAVDNQVPRLPPHCHL
ncbi:hypothetical protein Tco_1286222, partial [Tanacetum coccineum]